MHTERHSWLRTVKRKPLNMNNDKLKDANNRGSTWAKRRKAAKEVKKYFKDCKWQRV